MRRTATVVAGIVLLVAVGGGGFLLGKKVDQDRFNRCERVIEALADQPLAPPVGTRVKGPQFPHYAYPTQRQLDGCYEGDISITHG